MSKRPVIGEIFSSSSESDDSTHSRHSRATQSTTPSIQHSTNAPSVQHSDVAYDKTRLADLKANTPIHYTKLDNKRITNKYFKLFDPHTGTITLGFSRHDKRNYTENIANIRQIYVKHVSGGIPKDVISIPRSEWHNLKRDMILSYEKKNNHEWVRNAKFNAFVQGKDGTTRMSMTSERGYGYIVHPKNLATIYRHITSTDKITSFILERLTKLETRVKLLDQKIASLH